MRLAGFLIMLVVIFFPPSWEAWTTTLAPRIGASREPQAPALCSLTAQRFATCCTSGAAGGRRPTEVGPTEETGQCRAAAPKEGAAYATEKRTSTELLYASPRSTVQEKRTSWTCMKHIETLKVRFDLVENGGSMFSKWRVVKPKSNT